MQETILKRRSIREFLNQEIPRDALEKLVEAARHAPTARDEQPWEFVVITNQDKKRQLAKIANPNGAFIADCSAAIAVFCAQTKYYLEDGCAATENILISAAGSGIGSCWVAGDKKPYCEEIKRSLGAPEKYNLVSLIALGYPKNSPKILPKRKLEEVLHWENF